MTARDQEEQDLRIEHITAQLEQIRFQMEEARRGAASRDRRQALLARKERHRFYAQMMISIVSLAAATALILHLMGGV